MTTMKNPEEVAEQCRDDADGYAVQVGALEALRNEVESADRIGETRLSELFHEVRTSRKRTWKSATAFIDVEGGEAVVSSVSKLRDGRWSPETRQRHDAALSVPVRPFMDTQTFKRIAIDRLSRAIRSLQQSEQSVREKAASIERRHDID